MNKQETKFTKATVEMTERVKINVSVIDNPETFIKKLKQEKCLDQLDSTISSCDMLNGRKFTVFTKISQDVDTKEYYVILNKNAELDENIRVLRAVAFKLRFSYHRNFDADMLFAKLLLAAFGKEVA